MYQFVAFSLLVVEMFVAGTLGFGRKPLLLTLLWFCLDDTSNIGNAINSVIMINEIKITYYKLFSYQSH